MSKLLDSRPVRLLRNKRVYVTLELIGLAVLLGTLAWTLRDVWADAKPLLRHADISDVVVATAVVAVYYLVFVLGWMRILAAYGIRIPYRVALQSEMLSMLAKYIPGGVWTPTARVVALRRFGVKETPIVLASILLEAGLSAVAGVGRLPRRARDHRRRRRAAAAARAPSASSSRSCSTRRCSRTSRDGC